MPAQTPVTLAFFVRVPDLGSVGRRGTLLVAGMLCACSFSTFSQGRGSAGVGPEDEEEVDSPQGDGTTGGVADGGGDEGDAPPTTSDKPPDPTLPPGDGDGGSDPGDDGGGESSSSTSAGAIDPCAEPSTFKLGADDGTVTAPMVVVDVDGLGPAAYSTESASGQISFTIDVQCPGTYFVHAQVLDAWSGVHSCCDPDSYDVQWEGGGASWFYGCQTVSNGWHWLPVMHVEHGGDCDDAAAIELELEAGEHTLSFHNREGQSWEWDTVAAIANVVITNDAELDPESA